MWIKLVCLLCAVNVAIGLEGYKIVNVSPKTQHEMDLLKEISDSGDYDFLKLARQGISQVLVSPEMYYKLSNILEKYNIDFNIFNDNVLETAMAEKAENDRFCINSKVKMGTDCYRSHGEINAWLDELKIQYPNRVFLKHVGYSYERRELKTITITNGDGRTNKKVIFVDGGMHAREWISPATSVYVIQQLVTNFEAHKHLLEDYDWVVMPVINADGYEYTRSSASNRMWRKTRQPYATCTGADPNRNFDYMFGFAGTSSSSCMETYKGPKPFSEPETQVLRDVIQSYADRSKFYLTLHSYGSYLLYPWGYDRVLPETANDLDEVAKAGYDAILNATGRQYTYGNAAIVLYPAAGASDDYAFSQGIPIAVTMELPAGGSGFDPPPSDIKPYVEESWIGIQAMAEKVIEKY